MLRPRIRGVSLNKDDSPASIAGEVGWPALGILDVVLRYIMCIYYGAIRRIDDDGGVIGVGIVEHHISWRRLARTIAYIGANPSVEKVILKSANTTSSPS